MVFARRRAHPLRAREAKRQSPAFRAKRTRANALAIPLRDGGESIRSLANRCQPSSLHAPPPRQAPAPPPRLTVVTSQQLALFGNLARAVRRKAPRRREFQCRRLSSPDESPVLQSRLSLRQQPVGKRAQRLLRRSRMTHRLACRPCRLPRFLPCAFCGFPASRHQLSGALPGD